MLKTWIIVMQMLLALTLIWALIVLAQTDILATEQIVKVRAYNSIMLNECRYLLRRYV